MQMWTSDLSKFLQFVYLSVLSPHNLTLHSFTVHSSAAHLDVTGAERIRASL